MKKINPILITIGIIIGLLIIGSIYGLYAFFTTYGIQSPIILRSPIYKLHPEVIISPLSSRSASLTFDVGKIADKIYQLESSNGKNDGCRNLGLYNGYGYRQNSFEWQCYSSHEEVRQLVINWLEQNIKDGNIEQALCKYNLGINTNSCDYANNFNSL